MEVVSVGIQWGVEVGMYNGIAGTGGVEHVAAEQVQERSEEVRRCGKKWRVCPEVEKVWQSSLPSVSLEGDCVTWCGLLVMM